MPSFVFEVFSGGRRYRFPQGGCRGLALQQCQAYAVMPMLRGFKRVKTTPCQTKTYGEEKCVREGAVVPSPSHR